MRQSGYTELDGLWDEDVARALADEAERLWPSAQPQTHAHPRRGRPGTGQFLGATGPVVQNLCLAMASIARGCSGQVLAPFEAGYSYYKGDDELFLHVDPVDFILTTGVLGNLGPLHIHPDLEGLALDELAQIEADPTWDRTSGQPITYPKLGVTALYGRLIPHHRPGCMLGEVGAVALFAYRKCY